MELMDAASEESRDVVSVIKELITALMGEGYVFSADATLRQALDAYVEARIKAILQQQSVCGAVSREGSSR